MYLPDYFECTDKNDRWAKYLKIFSTPVLPIAVLKKQVSGLPVDLIHQEKLAGF